VSDNIFIGNAKKRNAPFWACGGSINISKIAPGITIEQIDPSIRDFCFVGSTGNVYINIDITENREPDKYGNTHAIKINTYKKPDQASSPGQPGTRAEAVQSVFNGTEAGSYSDSCPF